SKNTKNIPKKINEKIIKNNSLGFLAYFKCQKPHCRAICGLMTTRELEIMSEGDTPMSLLLFMVVPDSKAWGCHIFE
ncbi:MAG: hypothetical protein IJ899_04645, partial [Blautia sp.]|nr:hypothetical protein [Blautia sp.]